MAFDRKGVVAVGSKRLILAVVTLGVLGGSIAGAQEEKATGVVAVRQAAMKANGDHMTAIKAILTEYPELLAQVEYHADAIKESAEYTPAMFPPGSDHSPTSALPPVWSDATGFKAASEKAEGLAEKLADAAESGDAKATLAAFATLGKDGCGGCHSTFRKKDS